MIIRMNLYILKILNKISKKITDRNKNSCNFCYVRTYTNYVRLLFYRI